MYLTNPSIVKNIDGTIDVEVYIVHPNVSCKKYIYHLSSEFAARKFSQLYRQGRKLHGKVLSILNKFKIKEMDNAEKN